MTDARYWVTYTSKREHVTGCDSVVFERVADTSGEALGMARVFMRTARNVMENDSSVTKCFVHVYDCETGLFTIHRTLERVERCGGLHWFSYDE